MALGPQESSLRDKRSQLHLARSRAAGWREMVWDYDSCFSAPAVPEKAFHPNHSITEL